MKLDSLFNGKRQLSLALSHKFLIAHFFCRKVQCITFILIANPQAAPVEFGTTGNRFHVRYKVTEVVGVAIFEEGKN